MYFGERLRVVPSDFARLLATVGLSVVRCCSFCRPPHDFNARRAGGSGECGLGCDRRVVLLELGGDTVVLLTQDSSPVVVSASGAGTHKKSRGCHSNRLSESSGAGLHNAGTSNMQYNCSTFS
jgi:hypothetical protein